MDTIPAKKLIKNFFELEAAGGILLMGAAALAIVLANSPLRPHYDLLLSTPVEIRIGALQIAKPLLLWINDGLMAVFFFLVGLELKRELTEGELSEPGSIMLPGVGAVGGLVVPAAIYFAVNRGDPLAVNGWAIPAATDIAFVLGILSLVGSRVPTSIKVFLVSLAIFDDIAAITIIAVFYTENISLGSLMVATACIPVLAFMNRRNVTMTSPYLVVGLVMWVATLKSGIHATLAGVVLALFIPMRSKSDPEDSPLKDLEDDLHTVVAYFVLPVFAFANAGISLSGVGIEQLMHGVPLGIALGLIVGKQIGVFGACALAIRMGWAVLPSGTRWINLYGAAALCGVGFTMSLFIGSLAFAGAGPDRPFDERLGIILGSLVSGLIGFFVLRATLSDRAPEES